MTNRVRRWLSGILHGERCTPQQEVMSPTGTQDAHIRIFNTMNGLLIEYVWYPSPSNGNIFGGHQMTEDNIIRRIVTEDEYDKLGEIILQLHVTAACRKTRA